MPKLAGKGRRRAAVPVNALAGNVAHTADTAVTVLAHFRLALERSGMQDGLAAYRAMVETLINQRLWALRHDSKSGDERVKSIAAEARAIHALLAPYAELMARLAVLPQLTVEGAPGDSDAVREAPEDPVLAWLERQPGPVSATRIRAALRMPSPALEAHLRRLEDAGRVVRTGAAGRQLFAARSAS